MEPGQTGVLLMNACSTAPWADGLKRVKEIVAILHHKMMAKTVTHQTLFKTQQYVILVF